MALPSKLFRKRDLIVVVAGLVIMQLLICLLINRFMFYPVKGGYTEKLRGYMNVGTSEMPIAARIIGPQRGKKAILYCHGNAEDITAIDARFHELVGQGYTIATFDYPGYGLSGGSANEEGCYENAHRMYDRFLLVESHSLYVRGKTEICAIADTSEREKVSESYRMKVRALDIFGGVSIVTWFGWLTALSLKIIISRVCGK